jgi:DNA-directed RNA polymerase specialized sigma24 family protein
LENFAARLNKALGPAHRIGDVAVRGATVDELEVVYRGGLSRFVRTAAAITGDDAIGRDAVQEAFAQAVNQRLNFEGKGPLEAWVWRIVINEANRDQRGECAAA